MITILAAMSALAHAEPADVAAPEVTGGRFYLYIGEQKQEGYYLQDYTAFAAAVHLSEACWCLVRIDTPSLTVKPKREARESAQTISLTVHWDVPTEREKGGALPVAQIAKYVISYRREGAEELFVEVFDAAQTERIIEKLAPGTWFVRMATVDTAGAQSAWSPTVSKTK